MRSVSAATLIESFAAAPGSAGRMPPCSWSHLADGRALMPRVGRLLRLIL